MNKESEGNQMEEEKLSHQQNSYHIKMYLHHTSTKIQIHAIASTFNTLITYTYTNDTETEAESTNHTR